MPSASSKTVLLTSGRLPVGLELARAFHAAGWHVVVADPWPMHLCRMSRCVDETIELPPPQEDPQRFVEVLAQRCREYDVDLVVPVSEETLYVAGLLDSDVPVFTSARDEVLAVHDKLGFIQRAQEYGLDTPETARADEAAGPITDTAYVSKPRFSCSGRGVRFHRGGSVPSADASSIVQQRIDGHAVNAFCVAVQGETRLASAYRVSLADGSVAIAFEHDDDGDACLDWATRFIEASGYTGLIAFDFIVDADGKAWPLECNPRATSGIHFLRPAALVAAITGEDLRDTVFKEATQMAEKWSCFTRYLASLGKPDETREAWQVLWRFRDVSWRRNDPWPFLAMPFNSWRLLLKSLQRGHSFASAAVSDIEWRPAHSEDAREPR